MLNDEENEFISDTFIKVENESIDRNENISLILFDDNKNIFENFEIKKS